MAIFGDGWFIFSGSHGDVIGNSDGVTVSLNGIEFDMPPTLSGIRAAMILVG